MSLEAILEYLLIEVGTYRLTVGMLFGIVVTLLLAYAAMRLIGRVLLHQRERSRWDIGRRHSLYLILQYLIWIMAVALSLDIVGVRLSVLIAGSAALLVGLGLGVQTIFRDIVSGIFLLFEGTVEVGDLLQIDGTVARVEEIHLRTSKLATRDGLTLIVPNSRFITENVVNWSYNNRLSDPARFAVRLSVPYDADERRVREVLLACAAAHPDVVRDDPKFAPHVRLADLSESRQVFDVLFWTHRKFEVESVRSDLRYAMREALREHDISIAPGPSVSIMRLENPPQEGAGG